MFKYASSHGHIALLRNKLHYIPHCLDVFIINKYIKSETFN